MGYYEDKTLSFSSVRLFAQNPARALADYNGEEPWFKDPKPLLLGRAFHEAMEQMLTYLSRHRDETPSEDGIISDAFDALDLPELLTTNSDYEPLLTKKGLLTADAKRLPGWVKSLWQSSASDPLKLAALDSDTNTQLFLEKPFKAKWHGVAYKGKLDAFVVNEKEKVVNAYDFKTTRNFDPSGFEWGTDINGHRSYMPVEWTVEKLFPWQAGIYRELLRENGYADYQINYHYLTVTKQDQPRIDVFEISPEAMDLGFAQFAEALLKAYRIIEGMEKAPLVMDGSDFANRQTIYQPLIHKTVPMNDNGQQIEDDDKFLEALCG